MQADAYSGFNRLHEPVRRPAPIVEAACWAHARRKFFDLARLNKAPIAIEAVARIDALFAIERDINGEPIVGRWRDDGVVSAPGRDLVGAVAGDDTIAAISGGDGVWHRCPR